MQLTKGAFSLWKGHSFDEVWIHFAFVSLLLMAFLYQHKRFRLATH